MALCFENSAFGIFVKTDESVIKLENNRVSGVLGKEIQKFFDSKHVKNCTLKPVRSFFAKTGDPERNQSFIHFVSNNQLDLYFFPENLGILNDCCESSSPIRINEFQVSQVLPKPKEIDSNDLSSFLIYNKLLLMIILVGHFITILVIGILLRTIYKNINERFKLFSFKLIFYKANKLRILLSKIAVIILFFSCFISLNLILLTNSIKTNVVVINTDEFIDSQSKLDKTKKTPVIFKDSTHFQTGPYEKLKEIAVFIKPNMIGSKNLSKIFDKKIDAYYLFMNKVLIYVTIYYLSLELPKHHYHAYKKETNYHESFKVLYFRKNLEQDKKKLLNRKIVDSIEKGFFRFMHDATEKNFYDLAKSKIKIYFNLDEFINDYANSNGKKIRFDNFKSLFYWFFCIQSSILIIFSIVTTYKYWFKRSVERWLKQTEKQFKRSLRNLNQTIRIQIQMVFIVICNCISKIKG